MLRKSSPDGAVQGFLSTGASKLIWKAFKTCKKEGKTSHTLLDLDVNYLYVIVELDFKVYGYKGFLIIS